MENVKRREHQESRHKWKDNIKMYFRPVVVGVRREMDLTGSR
jgi:hypothetical protein